MIQDDIADIASNGADDVAKALLKNGVECVFSLCGNHLLPLYRAFVDHGIKIIDTRSEAAAVFAADGYARSGRRLGVVVVNGGPGFTNAITGLITAHTSGSPVLLISGAALESQRGQGQHQEIDQISGVTPFAKVAREGRVGDEIGVVVDEIIGLLLSSPSGAGSISIPLDVLTAPSVTSTKLNSEHERSTPREKIGNHEAAEENLLNALVDAEKVAVILGQGAYWEGAEDAVRQFCQLSSMPLFTMDVAHGSVKEDGQVCFGYPDRSLRPYGKLLEDADVIVLLGRGLDYRFDGGKAFSPRSKIFEVGANPKLPWATPAGLTRITSSVASLVAHLSELDFAAAKPERDKWLQKFKDEYVIWTSASSIFRREEDSAIDAMNPGYVAELLDSAMFETTCLAIDAGDFVQWCRSIIDPRGKGKWLRAGRMSTCGSALPMAIGAAVALSQPGLAVTGDGSLGYHLSEFETMGRLNIPVTCVVGNNNAWGLEYNLQSGLYGPNYTVASQLHAVDFTAIARSMGIRGIGVSNSADLVEAVKSSLTEGVPTLIQVQVTLSPSPLTRAVIDQGGRV